MFAPLKKYKEMYITVYSILSDQEMFQYFVSMV